VLGCPKFVNQRGCEGMRRMCVVDTLQGNARDALCVADTLCVAHTLLLHKLIQTRANQLS